MIDDMAVYIANLGKYNEGYLVGAWFTFPIDEEDVKEKIGLNEQYEEYAIHDTDNFPIAIGEYVSIEELNEMYEMIEELPDYIVECLDEFISHYGTLEEVVEHKDDIYYYPDCETMTDVAYYYIDELQALGDIPPSLQNYIDYEAYGEIWIWAVALLKQAEVCARYHINAGRSATSIVVTDSVFLFKGQSENGCPFLFRNLRKELKELEKD